MSTDAKTVLLWIKIIMRLLNLRQADLSVPFLKKSQEKVKVQCQKNFARILIAHAYPRPLKDALCTKAQHPLPSIKDGAASDVFSW